MPFYCPQWPDCHSTHNVQRSGRTFCPDCWLDPKKSGFENVLDQSFADMYTEPPDENIMSKLRQFWKRFEEKGGDHLLAEGSEFSGAREFDDMKLIAEIGCSTLVDLDFKLIERAEISEKKRKLYSRLQYALAESICTVERIEESREHGLIDHTFSRRCDLLLKSAPSEVLKEYEGECPICIQPLVKPASSENTEQACRTDCGHIFGDKCIRRWIGDNGRNASCPLCRNKFKSFKILDEEHIKGKDKTKWIQELREYWGSTTIFTHEFAVKFLPKLRAEGLSRDYSAI
jgi:hypothetical protein